MQTPPPLEADPNGEGITGWSDDNPPYLDGEEVSVFVWPEEEPGASVREPRRPRPSGGRPAATALDEEVIAAACAEATGR